MKIKCILEHNDEGNMLYAENFIGAFTRGKTKEAAMEKMEQEVRTYLAWSGGAVPELLEPEICQEKVSELNICDADTDVLFDVEKNKLTQEEYIEMKTLALKSAEDFLHLYESVPDKNTSHMPNRLTFYGTVPRTAFEMYEHTKNVNSYYFGEIGIRAGNEGTILECRKKGFRLLEETSDFLDSEVHDGSYGEQLSVRKLLRRFIWHDRIHGKAMYRMAVKTFGADHVSNVFQYDE